MTDNEIGALFKQGQDDLNSQKNIYKDLMSESQEDVIDKLPPKPMVEDDYNPEKIEISEEESSNYADDIDEMYKAEIGNSLTDDMVVKFKKQFPYSLIFKVQISDFIFVVRTLKRPEYKQLLTMPNLDNLRREEVILLTTVLYPEAFTYKDIAKIDAGIPSTLSNIIMEASGFTDNYAIEVL